MSVPVLLRPLYERAMAGTASPREAIKAKCQECCAWEDVRERVGNCTIQRCPLWLYRPYQHAARPADRTRRETEQA